MSEAVAGVTPTAAVAENGKSKSVNDKPRKRSRSRSPRKNRSPSPRRSSRDRASRSERDRKESSTSTSGSSKSSSSSRRDRSPPRAPRSPPKPRKTEEEREAERREREIKRRMDEEDRKRIRDESTVLVSQIHPKVKERDLFDFFSLVGRVNDIQLIRDARTQKSKGLCYVEFGEKDSLTKALALSNQLLMGYPITVQVVPQLAPTQSIKTVATGDAMRLYVGSLHFNVSEADLRPIFEAFGTVDFIEIQRENGQSRGFGFVQYAKSADARQAMAQLNGLEIAGRPIKVNVGDQITPRGGGPAGERDMGMGSLLEEEEGGAGLTAQSRASLMAKLSRGTSLPGANMTLTGMPAVSQYGFGGAAAAAIQSTPVLIQSTTCVVVKNMFDPATESEPDFDLDIKEDVEAECSKSGGLPTHLFVDKQSQGNVFLKFKEKSQAEGIVRSLNGRWFAGRQITAEYLSEATYRIKFPHA